MEQVVQLMEDKLLRDVTWIAATATELEIKFVISCRLPLPSFLPSFLFLMFESLSFPTITTYHPGVEEGRAYLYSDHPCRKALGLDEHSTDFKLFENKLDFSAGR